MKTIQNQIIGFVVLGLLLTPNIYAASYPIADFSADITSGPPGIAVQFTDLSTGDISYWEWEFNGDGVADSTEQHPSFVYNYAGTYTVSLYVSGPWGEDGMTKTGYIQIVLSPGDPGTVKWELDLSYSPAVSEDGTLYLAGDGNLYSVNQNGEILWSYQTGRTGDSMPPAINGDTIYFSSIDNSYLYAVNSNGSLNWEILLQQYGKGPHSASIGSDGTLYFICSEDYNSNDFLIALNPDGSEKWVISSLSKLSRPVVDHDGNIYIIIEPYLIKYNSDGSKLWELDLNGQYTQPIALGKHIYALANQNIYAVNYDGTIAWESSIGHQNTSDVVVGDNVVYAKATTFWLGGRSTTTIYAFSADMGVSLWTLNNTLRHETLVIGSDGTIYAGSSAISPDGQGKWSLDIGFKPYSVICNKILYVAGAKLYAINAESQSVAGTPWPMYQHDPQHTGRQDVDYPSAIGDSSFPVYRFWSDMLRGHFYTANLSERDHLICCNPDWNYEGIAFYAYPNDINGTMGIFRFWSDTFRGHFYTISEFEKDYIIGNDPNWAYEGVAYYAVP